MTYLELILVLPLQYKLVTATAFDSNHEQIRELYVMVILLPEYFYRIKIDSPAQFMLIQLYFSKFYHGNTEL